MPSQSSTGGRALKRPARSSRISVRPSYSCPTPNGNGSVGGRSYGSGVEYVGSSTGPGGALHGGFTIHRPDQKRAGDDERALGPVATALLTHWPRGESISDPAQMVCHGDHRTVSGGLHRVIGKEKVTESSQHRFAVATREGAPCGCFVPRWRGE